MAKSFAIILVMWSGLSMAQYVTPERLEQQVATAKTDTARVNRLLDLSEAVGDEYIRALQYSKQALELAEQIQDKPGVARAKLALGQAFSHLNEYIKRRAT